MQYTNLPTETVALAKALVGMVLWRETPAGITSGRIVEVEAYTPGDPASHAFIGVRKRNAAMFLAPFHAYVYRIYGRSWCVNVSSEERGIGAAVLVRALEPLDGLALMRERRGTQVVRDLCRGPGRLCSAMQIDASLDGIALGDGGPLRLLPALEPRGRVRSSVRIGISKAISRRHRFYEASSPYVSGPKSLGR